MRSMWDYFGRRGVPIAARLVLALASIAVILQSAPALVSAQNMAYDPAVLDVATSPRAAPASPVAATPTRAEEPRQRATARLSSINVRRELAVDRWLRPGEWVWNDDGAPATGQVVIVANIRARVMSVYRAGHEIGRTSMIYGADNKPTPLGTFPILQKRADHWSNLYDAPMPHMQRLTWDGVAIHGAMSMADDAATRGCLGIPLEFAELLFRVTRVGDQVMIWDGVTSA